MNFSKCAGGFPKAPALLAACFARCCYSLLSAPESTTASTYFLSPHSLSLSLLLPRRSAALLPRPSVLSLEFPLIPFAGQASRLVYFSHLTPSLASPSSSAALLPRPSVSPFVVVFRSLVAAPFNCVIPSLRTAARDHLAVPRYMASYFHALLALMFSSLLPYRRAGPPCSAPLPGALLISAT